jgi:hypothetical protein
MVREVKESLLPWLSGQILPAPVRLLHAPAIPALPPSVIDLAQRRLGEHVETRDLHEYEAAL